MPLFAWTVLVYEGVLLVASSVGDSARVLLAAVSLAGALSCMLAGRRNVASILVIAAAAPLVVMSLTRGIGADGNSHVFDAGAPPSDTASAALWPRVRARTGLRIDRIFANDAPMVRALVIADMSAIPSDVRDRYAAAGLVHMLSVSGLHVGIVALALELLASVLRLPRGPARVITLIILSAYIAAIGAPPPAVRAAVMLGALLISRGTQRPTSPWSILALGALAPVWDANTVQDLGWQLSVAGTAALIAGGALATRFIPRKWRGHKRALCRAALISVVATVVTAPMVAWTFGRISLLGPLTNLLADPVMALLQPMLFLVIALPIPLVEITGADAAHALIGAFDFIAATAARIPFSAPLVFPTVGAAVASGAGSVALIVACVAKRPMRAWLVYSCCASLLVLGPLVSPGPGVPELHMIDVGQGDALALRSSRGRWIVVDAGRSWIGGDAGKKTVVPYLSHRGGDVALFVLSHPHADHVGGAASLFSMMRPGRFLDPGYVGTTSPYLDALAEAKRDGIAWSRITPGDSIVVDDIVLHELAPDSSWAAQLTDANLASSILLATMGGARVLLTGDAETPEEDWLLAHAAAELHADVLKVGHHGSITSTSPQFLDAVRPKIALISVGKHNSYGHPDREVLDQLHAAKVLTMRTDLSGTVVLRFNRDRIDIRSQNQSYSVMLRKQQQQKRH